MFGEEVTPNHHKLANEFVLLDNLYCNGHVSADGHPWSTMAYNTDYIARNWALTYSEPRGHRRRRRGRSDARPPAGYLWDVVHAARPDAIAATANTAAASASPTARSGWKAACRAWSATCARTTALPKGRASGCATPTTSTSFLEEFREFEKNDNLPRFIVMSLGEDHTDGHDARRVHAAGLRGQQRPGPGPAGRSGQPEQVLAGDGDLRHRGRRPERPRPRRCPPHRRPGDQPLHPSASTSTARSTRTVQHDPHDGADPGPAAAEPVRRGGHSRCSPRSPTRPT